MKAQHKLALDLYQDGKSLREIRASTGYSPSFIYHLIAKHDIPKRHPQASRDNQRRAIDMYLRNAPVKNILRATGISRAGLYKKLHSLGIPLRRS